MSVYVAPLLLASFEDCQEIFVIRDIDLFSKNIFIANLYHKIDPIIIILL